MKQIELFGSGLKGISAQLTEQTRINCFYELIPDGDKTKIFIRGTPGLTIWDAVPNNQPIRGWYTYNNILYLVAGQVLYSINPAGVITLIGNISSGTALVSMNSNLSQLIIVDGTTGWIYTYATNLLVQIGFGMVLGLLTGGTLYTAGTYTNVPITGGSGIGAVATITVAGGAVTNVVLTSYGNNYVVGDSLSANSADIGGTGSGFNILVSQINTGFPFGATTAGYLDGYFICEFPLSQQWALSNINDGTNWNALQFASASSNPDNLYAIDVINSTIILWGTNSIEFWQDAGIFPFPMQRLSGSTSSYGLAAKWSRAQVGNSILFLGQTPQGTLQIYSLDNLIVDRISTHAIEHILSGLTTTIDAVAISYIIDGHSMYQLSFPTANISLLYDVTTRAWSYVQTGISIARQQANLGIVFNGLTLMSDFDSGNIYSVSSSVYTEEGDAILRQVDSRHIWDGGNIFTISELWVDMDTGEGLQLGQGSNPQIMMQVSKDGGRTFGSPRVANIGKVGQYSGPRAIWRRIGSGRDFVFRFTMTDPVPFLIISGSAIRAEAPQG